MCLAPSSLAATIKLMQLEDIGSDHLPVKIEMEFEPAYNEICTKKRWKTTKEYLKQFSEDIPPSRILQPNNIDCVLEDFTDRLLTAAKDNIPQTSGKARISKSLVWWDDECSDKLKERRKAWRRMIKYPTVENIQSFKENRDSFKKIKEEK